jgi:alpha-tubulin suppressor-like RCC1 family protein
VSAGDQFTCGLTTDGVPFCWGLNLNGQLGLGTDTGPELCFTGDGDNACSMKPARVRGGLIFSRLGTGSSHACGLTRDGTAYCWGASFAGQLGRGTSTGEELKPARVAGSLVFGSLDIGGFHSCGVTTDRAAWCWGSNLSGELGTGSAAGPETCPELATPCATRPVRAASGLVFRDVVPGSGSHTCGLTMARRIYCWGANGEGQLGDGTTRSSAKPRRVVL